jgi:hypothetical protein
LPLAVGLPPLAVLPLAAVLLPQARAAELLTPALARAEAGLLTLAVLLLPLAPLAVLLLPPANRKYCCLEQIYF